MIGLTLHHYQIRELIGAGGMGVVYKALDLHLDRTVAIKVLPPELAADRERRDRFAREGRAVAALSHPNIVTIYAVEEHDGTPFLAMEYLEGKTLDRLIPPGGLELGRFFQIAIPIADALTAAHERHVTHRDLKPANVMVSETGSVKVLDFGLAKLERPAGSDSDPAEAPTATLTHAGRLFGTVPYMSPEQVQGQRIDHLSDLFSLGALLYEMATGRTPFAGSSTADLISSILRDTPPSVTDLRPELPRHLARIIRHCLEKEPARRYQTALDVANELRDLQSEIDSGEHAEARRSLPRIVAEARLKTHISPLVGRQAELAELRRLLEQARGGHGSLTLIGGEPGVGKTRLIEELIPAARELGFLTLVGHCYDTEGARPWSPWVEILEYSSRVAQRDVLRQLLGDGAAEVAKLLPELRRLYPDIPKAIVLPPEQERHYLFTSFREYLERSSQAQPLLLALEDLQWADESTLLLLQHLAPHLGGMAILALGTYRDDELDVSRPLGGVLRHLVRERLVHRVALKSLPAPAVAEMLAGLSEHKPPQALVAAIFKTTEGNPFFVEEVFGHLREEGSLLDQEGRFRRDLRIEDLEVPEGVRLVVGRRLEKLGEEARKALTAAAVIGRRFHFDLLEALGDSPAEALVDAIEEAERLQLIKPVPGREIRFDFAQELVRQTLAGSLSSMRRQRLHLRIAEAMERVFAGDLDNHASELAHHLYEAGAAADPQKTGRYLVQAGRQALAAAASTEALRRFEDALSMVDPEDRAARADLLFRHGLALRSLARWEEARRDWLEAMPLYQELGNTDAVVRITLGAADLIMWTQRWREAATILQRALDFVGEVPTPGRCRLLAAAATAIALAGDIAAARPMMEEAFATAERLAVGPRVLGEMLGSKAWMHYAFLEYGPTIETARRGGELLAKRDEHGAASNLSVVLNALLRCGRLRESAALASELEPQARRLGHSGALFWVTEEQAARIVMERGDFAAVLGLAEIFEGHLRAVGQPISASLALAGLAHFWAGRLEESLRCLTAGYEAFDRPELMGNFVHGDAWAILFTVRAVAGERQAALAMLEKSDARMPHSGEPILAGECSRLLAAVEGLAALGERERAAELYPLVLESLRTDHVVRRFGQGLVRTVAGIGAACARQWEEAEEHFGAALELAYALPHVVEQAEVRYWHARMLLERNAAGDRERADDLLGAAIEIYQKLGMPLHLARARELSAPA